MRRTRESRSGFSHSPSRSRARRSSALRKVVQEERDRGKGSGIEKAVGKDGGPNGTMPHDDDSEEQSEKAGHDRSDQAEVDVSGAEDDGNERDRDDLSPDG